MFLSELTFLMLKNSTVELYRKLKMKIPVSKESPFCYNACFCGQITYP